MAAPSAPESRPLIALEEATEVASLTGPFDEPSVEQSFSGEPNAAPSGPEAELKPQAPAPERNALAWKVAAGLGILLVAALAFAARLGTNAAKSSTEIPAGAPAGQPSPPREAQFAAVRALGPSGLSGTKLPEGESDPQTLSQKPPPRTPPPACSNESVLDDFEDGDGHLCAADGRSGVWGAYFDGTGTLTPTPGFYVRANKLDPPRGASQWGLNLKGQGIKEWGAGLVTTFRETKAYDISQYRGVRMWVHTPRP
jgi:hypothetical protein